jgi:hypothetical protein
LGGHAVRGIRCFCFAAVLVCALGLAAVGLTWPAGAAQEGTAATILPAIPQTNLFGGKDANTPREVSFPLMVSTPRAFKGHVSWTFAIGNAPIQSAEVPLANAPGKPTRIILPLRVPFVREGLVVKGKLVVDLLSQDQRTPVAHYEQPLWIFHPQPFAQRQAWLKDLKIILYDPRETTAPVLKKMDIPFEEAPNLSSLSEIKSGLILVGEGVSFEDERELPELLVKAAARGVPVLCLAPAKGMLPLPGMEDNALPSAQSVALHRGDIIAQLDKRLDIRGWPPDGRAIASALAVKAVEGNVVAEVTDGTSGWPWLEIAYAREGRLVVCGFGLMSHWEAGPAPRYFFARLLERLNRRRKDEG